MTMLGCWSSEAERAGFASVGVIDRLVYENLDPLVALAAAAACTSRVELVSTVVNVCWRRNAELLAKQLSSVHRLSRAGWSRALAWAAGQRTTRPAECR
jgi:alkanesulfonate monooxygenase SsuD/methylene tetrahydromethanopterin reductase-like flavin-dependent oxidoreductase (luciferase family)